MKSTYKLTMIVFLVLFLLVGCTVAQTNRIDSQEDSTEAVKTDLKNGGTDGLGENLTSKSTEEGDAIETGTEDSKVDIILETTEPIEPIEPLIPEIDYQVIKPDESKEIMVIMYHNLSDKNTAYGRTVESFKQDLERLYKMGFRTISMQDYIQNNITTEAGYTPVVLTFDDGHATNFKYIEKGDQLEIDPNCVVGILDEFSRTHPDFGRHAIFYLNYGNAFGQSEYLDQKLDYLLENGYEIGNHSFSHEDLSTLDANGIQTALGKNASLYQELNSQISMNSLALPFGKRPKEETLKNYLETGIYEGYTYENQSILLVGWKPYYPVYHVKYDSNNINRVQSGDGEMQLSWWLDNYEKSPSKRFISDGNPNRISIPTKDSDQIDESKIGERELYLYEIVAE